MTEADGAPAPMDCVNHFHVTADLCPQALLRILGLVSQLSLIPLSLSCARSEDGLEVEIAVDGLSDQRAAVLLAKIETIVTVREARLIAPVAASGCTP
jgi:acetolactate synthase regulatory subunit